MAALWDKVAIWKKSPMKPRFNIDYVLIDSDDEELKTGVGIQTGKFAVCYIITAVQKFKKKRILPE